MRERSCGTRALKLARHLQRTRPDIVPPTEPVEGFGALLEGTDPSMKFVLREAFGPGGVPTPRWSRGFALFGGSVTVVRLSISAGSRQYSIRSEDAEVVRSYLGSACAPIGSYLGSYGPTDLTIDDHILDYPVELPRGVYNDTLLAGWLDGLVRSGAIPTARTALVVLAPPGPLNMDADPGRGSIGYHAAASVPYAFVNVAAGPLRRQDATDAFALATSHSLAELVADPLADLQRPEVCDPCGPNCRLPVRAYFGAGGAFVAASSEFPPSAPYDLFVHAIVAPSSVGECPAPESACTLPPPPSGKTRGDGVRE